MKALFLILGLVAVVAGIFALFGIFWCIGAMRWLVTNLYVQYMLRKPEVQALCIDIAKYDYEGTSYENLSDWGQEEVAEEAINKVSRLPFRIPVDSFYSARYDFFTWGIVIAVVVALVGIVAVAGGGLLWYSVYGEPFVICN
jgi:hypothetical protein